MIPHRWCFLIVEFYNPAIADRVADDRTVGAIARK